MNDKLSSSWLLVVGSILVAFFYYRGRPKGKSVSAGKETGTAVGGYRADPSAHSKPSGKQDPNQEWFKWPKGQFDKIDEGIRKGTIKPKPGFYNPKDLERMRMGYTPPFWDDERTLAWEVG
jgi:hypothetical protein